MALNLGAAQLRGRVARWSRPELALLVALLAAGFWLRFHALAAGGFADDEIHKWLAANRYLHGDFGGDDLEHPMLMKALIALCIAVLPKSVAPEALTRLPNVLASTIAIWAVAQLGRRLYGKPAALIAAGICALSAMVVGYSRIAKEDTLFALFLTLALWCLAEARARASDGVCGSGLPTASAPTPSRWEVLGAVFLGASFASKYFVFTAALIPLTYLAVRRGSAWRVPLRRWLLLSAIGLGTMLLLDWVVLFPSTLEYIHSYLAGDHLGDRAQSESYFFMGRLYDNLFLHLRGATPGYFHLVFAAVKFAPPTVLLCALGLAVAAARRGPSDRILLLWIGFMLAVTFFGAAKYARYFICLIPPFVLLAGMAAVWLAQRLRSSRAQLQALAGLAVVALGTEAFAAVSHEPHPRLYINAFGGGDAKVDWFFPHCDYFDAGVREAVKRIAARAEPNAEVASETRWLVRYYAGVDGRRDLTDTSIVAGQACAHGRVCYVIVQNGRRYWHNQAALDRLAQQKPWSTVQVGGHASVRIYRLAPGATLFPEPHIATRP